MNEFDFDDENREGECKYCKRCNEHEFLLDGRNCCIIHQRFERGVLWMSICEHCKHYKTKKLNGVIVSEYCKKGGPVHSYIKCNSWSRSWKSRLGLVEEFHEWFMNNFEVENVLCKK